MRTPYRMSIELSQQSYFSGTNLTGQAVLFLDDVFQSKTGLDIAQVRLSGYESVRYCDQKKDQPKKNKNRNLKSDFSQIQFHTFKIHDFMGHKNLNGGRYNLPFSIPIPPDAAPSFEIAPVELSSAGIFYYLEVTIFEKDNNKKVQRTTLMTERKPVKIQRQHTQPPTIDKVYKQHFKGKGITSLL